MNQRLLLTAATAVLVASGCVNDSPLYVTGFSPLDPNGTGGCQLSSGMVSQFAGTLDLSGGAPYQLVASMRNEMDSEADTVTDEGVALIKGKQRNSVILDQINFTYTSTATATVPVITFEAETVPITIVIEPNGVQNIQLGLLGPKAYEMLGKSIKNAGESSDVRVKFNLSGNINSGGQIKSSPISFPIKVYRSGFTCSTGNFICGTGACGAPGGQDGSKIVCSDSNPDGGVSLCPSKLAL